MGLEIYFYVSVKPGLHESRSIPGYWLRNGSAWQGCATPGNSSHSEDLQGNHTSPLPFQCIPYLGDANASARPSLLHCSATLLFCTAHRHQFHHKAFLHLPKLSNTPKLSGRSLTVSSIPQIPTKAATVKASSTL